MNLVAGRDGVEFYQRLGFEDTASVFMVKRC
jgi:hypothetical protein